MSRVLKEQQAIRKLEADKQENLQLMQALLEDGEMEAEEVDSQYDDFEKANADIDAKIAVHQKNIKRFSDWAAKVDLQKQQKPQAGHAGGQIGRIEDQWKQDPKCGFRDHRDFFSAVMESTVTGSTSPQLNFLATAGSDEANTQHDAYGGYFIPEGLLPGVQTVPVEADPTISLVTNIPMTATKVSFNARVDKNHSTSVAGGVSMYRRAEAQTVASSRMEFEQVKFDTNGLFGISYATEEILERSPVSFAAMLDAAFGEAYTSKVMAEKFSGTGVGEPLGILNADCKIRVAKESGQAADTINATNLTKMRARIYRYSTAIWLANHDTIVQLMSCHIAGTNSDSFLFVPGNGTDKPDTLFGRPIYFTEWAKTVGDEGDITLCNWSEYGWGTYGSPRPQRAESMHVRFLNHERAFKFYVYNDGQPLWNSPLTPANSSSTLSPFVTLAARA